MNRLTERFEDDGIKAISVKDEKEIPDVYFEGEHGYLAAERLAEYEIAEEQGTLVKLPCKVGDSVFIIVGKDISKQKVKEIRIFDNRIEFVTTRRAFGIGDFGGNVFLTRKEAKEKLDRK